MWSASESALVIDMNLKYDAVVKLAAGVEGSVVAGKVGFGDSLAQSKLGKNNEPLTLTAAEGTDKVCYTLKNRLRALRSRKMIWWSFRRGTL